MPLKMLFGHVVMGSEGAPDDSIQGLDRVRVNVVPRPLILTVGHGMVATLEVLVEPDIRGMLIGEKRRRLADPVLDCFVEDLLGNPW